MKAILSGFLFFYSLFAHADNLTTMTVDSSNPKFVVTLPANPTTGYQWTVTNYDKKILMMTGSKFLAPRTRLMGAGGQMTFTFARVKGKSYPKSTQLSFTYARSWEPKSATLKKVTVNFIGHAAH